MNALKAEIDQTLEAILAEYALVPPVEVFVLPNPGSNNQMLGVRTGRGEFVWKTFRADSALDAILYEHALLRWLADQGLSFALPVPVLTRDGTTVSRTSAGWHSLSERLFGTHPDVDDLTQVEAMGAALGELHVGLNKYPVHPQPGLSHFGDLYHIHPALSNPFSLTPGDLDLPDQKAYSALFTWWRDELDSIRAFIESSYPNLPWQVIHRDFDPSNTLVHGAQVTAMLDFEFAGPDARALDIASGLKFTMRMGGSKDAWDVASAFCRGYARWVPFSRAEVEAVPWLIRLREVTSTVYKLGCALVAGNVRPKLQRVRDMQVLKHWLELNGERLVDVIGQEFI